MNFKFDESRPRVPRSFRIEVAANERVFHFPAACCCSASFHVGTAVYRKQSHGILASECASNGTIARVEADRDTIGHGLNTKRFAIVWLRRELLLLPSCPASVRSFVRSFVASRENLYAARVETRYLLIYAPPREFNILGASGARAATDSLFPQSTGQKRVGRTLSRRRRREKETRRKWQWP